jgi:Na+/melibiose symporter-like transporter
METLERIIDLPSLTPYRTRDLRGQDIQLDQNGHLTWSEDDVENPKNWSKARRWYFTGVVNLLMVSATVASSGPSGCFAGISEHFHKSQVETGLVITLYLLGFVAGPLVWAPLSEFYGRKIIFLGTFSGYFAFNFLCAFTNSWVSTGEFPASLV